MSNILKLILLVSLILYSLCTECSGLNQAQCEEASSDCTYTETAAKCEGTGCSLVTGTTCQTSNGCTYVAAVQASCTGEGCALNTENTACQTESGCTFTAASAAKCNGEGCTVSGDTCVTTSGCTYVPAGGTCSAKTVNPNDNIEETSPTTFTTTTIKLTSVSGKNVVLSITPVEAEKNYKTTAKASITGLSLTDGDQFTESLTCEIPSGSKLSSVTCTIKNAATDGNKYKLSGTATITSTGNDVFGTATPDTNSEVTASTQNDEPQGSNSHYLQFSFMIFMFLFLY